MKTLTYAWRFLARSKAYTIINILGLSFSLACCLILMRYIHRELTVDTHCVDRNEVYGVIVDMEGSRGLSSYSNGNEKDSTYIDPRFIEMIGSAITMQDDYVLSGNQRFQANVLAVDSGYLQLFPYRVVEGKLSLDNPQSAYLMEAFARKLFGKENPVGKVLRYSNGKDVTVAGVLAEPTCKTLIRFDVLLSSSISEHWERMQTEFYRFSPGTDMTEINRIASNPRFVNPHMKDIDTRQETFSFIPLKEIYWEESVMKKLREDQMFSYGVRSYLYVIGGISLLLFLTGMINFLNLYLVSSLKRGKEYGVKRIFGIHPQGLFGQMWLENLLLVGIALFFAWLWMEITTPWIEHLLACHFVYTVFDVQLSVVILVFLPLLTAGYSYLKYSRMSPIVSIQSVGQNSRSVRVRMVFLFVQYLFCFLLVTLSLYFNQQLSLMLHTDPGIRTKDIIQANLIYESRDMAIYRDPAKIQERIDRIYHIDQQLNACPHIQQWIAGHEWLPSPGYNIRFTNEAGQVHEVCTRTVSADFFRLFDVQVLEGALPEADDQRGTYFVANKAAMKAFGFDSCENARIAEDSNVRASRKDPWKPVCAVVEDTYMSHVSEGIKPTIYRVYVGYGGDFYQIACAPGHTKDVLDYLRTVELDAYGSEDFEYSLLEDDMQALYRQDRQVAYIYTVFAMVAIAVSCLGLFGLSLFDVRQRYREIGIRKVNGAQLKDIYRLLFRKYMFLLLVSFAVSIPVAVAVIIRYTENFAVKAPLGAGIFLWSLLLVSVISLGTLFWQVNRAARINPADVIKRE